MLSVEDGAGLGKAVLSITTFLTLACPCSVQSLSSYCAAKELPLAIGQRCKNEIQALQLHPNRDSDGEHRNSCQTVLATVL